MSEVFTNAQVADFEHATWSRCATSYMDGFGALVGEAVEPLLDALGVEPESRVLDLGTGPGVVVAAVRERGAHPIGVDFSSQMLEEARRRYPDVEFYEAPIESLPFEDRSFDAVAGNFVLHHSGAPDAALQEAARVLRGGGRIGLTVWESPELLEAFGLFFTAVEQHAGAADLPHGPLFGVSEAGVFEDMLSRAGFESSSVTRLDISWRTPSIDPVLAAFSDWANLSTFPEAVRAAIESTVRENAEKFLAGGRYVIPNPAILISASK